MGRGLGYVVGKERQGKERKEIDIHVPREAKETRKWADLWGMQKVRNSGEKGGGVIRECCSENQDYFTTSVLRMGIYFQHKLTNEGSP